MRDVVAVTEAVDAVMGAVVAAMGECRSYGGSVTGDGLGTVISLMGAMDVFFG